MAEPRSTAQEAGDPSTSPERLLELTEKHPQLHRLIVQNPSCPEVARQWILATNQWAKRAYEEGLGAAADAPEHAEQADTAEAAPMDGDAAEDAPADAAPGDEVPADEDREDVSVWGDLGLGASAAAAPQERPAEAPTSSVRIAQNSSVVPLGSSATASTPPTPASPSSATPAPGPAAATAAAPAAAAQSDYTAYPDHGVAPVPGEGTAPAKDTAPAFGAAPAHGAAAGAAAAGGAAAYGTGPAPAVGAAAAPLREPTEDDGSRTRRRTLFACGGCLVLALLLVLGLTLLGRAWLGGDDEEYQRDSTTTAAEESPSPEPTEEETTAEPTTPDPVSPAPEGAREMSSLRSPTGNISCLLEEDSVSCSVLQHDYSGSGAEGCASGPFSITVAKGNPTRACGSSFLDDSADTLEYDDSAVHGNMACTSRFDGMTCWNTITGRGFMVNRSTYETF